MVQSKDPRHEQAVRKWIATIQAYEDSQSSSGMSASSWCAENSINYQQFLRWRSFFRKHSPDSTEAAVVDITSMVTSRRPGDTSPNVNSCVCSPVVPSVIIQVNGMQIYVNNGIDETTLSTVMRVVRND